MGWVWKNLDQIRKALLHLAELADAPPQQDASDPDAHIDTGHKELKIATQNTPPESIDHTNHRIDGIQQSPLLRDNR